ncbi:SLC13 family permease [Vibrio rotiferianus]|uniref:SLC13 family permease n=1 Tax=Vibrio rotiferianus TaxID=190895 RepID=UPI00406A7993
MLFTATVILVLLILLATTKIRPAMLFMMAVLCLYAYGDLSLEEVTSNITNHSVLTLICLMLASLALEKSQLLPWVSTKVFRPSYTQTISLLGISTALSSALLNNTAVVATLMGAVKRNQDHPAQKLLLPLSYFAILGGTLTLIGTSTNLVVNALLIDAELPSLHFLSFFPVGIALVLVVGSVVIWSTKSLTAKDKAQQDKLDYFIDAEVVVGSKLIGKSVQQNRLRALDGLFLVEIVRQGQLISPVTPETLIFAQDKLIFAGDVKQIKQLQLFDGLRLFSDDIQLLESNLTEVIVSPESVLVSKTLKETEFRSRFDAAVVAISRDGERLSGKLGEQVLRAGDKLVLAVGTDFDKRQNLSRNFFFLSGKTVEQPLTGWQNALVILGFLAAIVASIVSSITLLESMVGYLIALIIGNALDSSTIRRRFPFELWLILVSALCLAQAFVNSGLAEWISTNLFQMLNGYSAYTALIVVFITTLLLTEIITNTAAAAIVLPVGIALAKAFGVDSSPFIMAVAYAASASFLTPYGYQTNLMVMNAGGYKVKDFIRVGWKVSLAYTLVALVTIPLVFPF